MRSALTACFGLATLVCIALAPTPLSAQGKQETGMSGGPVFTTNLKGDFVVAGTSTRIFQGPPQSEPFDLNVAGIPAGSTIVKAYADWNFLTDDVNNAANKTIEIDGNAYNGTLVGSGSPDLGWGRKFGASYLADITAAVNLTGGNGTYTVGSITDNAVSYGEGVSFLVIYSNPTDPLRQVDVYDGYTSTSSGNATAKLKLLSPYRGGATHFFINALDGQAVNGQTLYTNDVYVNGKLASGILPGTGPARHAWQGRLGPGAPGTNYYDQAEGDTSGFMRNGATSLTIHTIGYDNGRLQDYSDLVGHSFAAITFNAVPEGSTLATLSIGVITLLMLSRRKRGRSI